MGFPIAALPGAVFLGHALRLLPEAIAIAACHLQGDLFPHPHPAAIGPRLRRLSPSGDTKRPDHCIFCSEAEESSSCTFLFFYASHTTATLFFPIHTEFFIQFFSELIRIFISISSISHHFFLSCTPPAPGCAFLAWAKRGTWDQNIEVSIRI